MSAFLSAFLPMWFELVIIVGFPRYALHTVRALVWVLALSALSMFGLLSAWHSWVRFAYSSKELDMLVSGATKRSELAQTLERALSVRRQLAFCILGAGASSTVFWLVQPYVEAKLEIGFISYVSMFWSTFLGSNCAYWIIFFVGFARRVLVPGEVHLIWHSPASTPGIAALSRGFAFSTAATLVAFATIEYLAVRVSSYGNGEALQVVINVVPLVGGLGFLALGVVPHWLLFVSVRHARMSALRTLVPLTGTSMPTTAKGIERRLAIVDLYRLIESSPGLPFSTSAMVQYVAALLGAVAAFIIAR